MASAEVQKLKEELRLRNLHLTIIDTIEKAKQSAKNEKEFFLEIAKYVQRIIRIQSCYVVFPEKQEIFSDTKFPNEELLLQIAEDSVGSTKPIVINDTKPHKTLRKAKVKNLLAFASPKEKYTFILVNRPRGFKNMDCIMLSLTVRSIQNQMNFINLKQELDLKGKEIEIIDNVGTIRSTIKDVNVLIETILNEILRIIPSEATFFLMYDKNNQETQLKVAGKHPQSPFVRKNTQLLNKLATYALNQTELTRLENLSEDIKSAIAVPVLLQEGSMGVFCVVNSKNRDGFTKKDTTLLTTIAKQTGYAIFEDMEKAEIKRIFGRYVDPGIIDSMLKDKDKDYMQTNKNEITILFSDLRGFTTLTEKTAPETIVAMLNEHFEAMTNVILKHRGTIDKFMGDGIMAIFGAPIYYESHALRAIKTALDMQLAQEKLSLKWYRKYGVKVSMGVGICTGDVVVGNVGSHLRTDYTAIGDSVNIASRLCSHASPGQILASARTYDDARKSVSFSRSTKLKVKGKAKPLTIYPVKNLKLAA